MEERRLYSKLPPELMPPYRPSIAFRGEPDPVMMLKVDLHDLCFRNVLFWANPAALSVEERHVDAYGVMLEIAMRAVSANRRLHAGNMPMSLELKAVTAKLRDDLEQLQKLIGDDPSNLLKGAQS